MVLLTALAAALAAAVGVVILVAGSCGLGAQPVGTIFVYEIDAQRTSPAIEVAPEAVVAALDRRLNPGWLKTAQVQAFPDGRIEIGVFGYDPRRTERIQRLVENAGVLEFRIAASRDAHADIVHRAMLAAAQAPPAEEGREPARAASATIRDARGNLLAWWAPVAAGHEGDIENDPRAVYSRRRPDRSGVERLELLVVKDQYDVTGAMLTRAAVGRDMQGRACIDFTLDATGAQRFGSLTAANLPGGPLGVARRLAILLDGQVQSAPTVQSTIYDRGQISGSFSEEEAAEIVAVLNAGALPAVLRRLDVRQQKPGTAAPRRSGSSRP